MLIETLDSYKELMQKPGNCVPDSTIKDLMREFVGEYFKGRFLPDAEAHIYNLYKLWEH